MDYQILPIYQEVKTNLEAVKLSIEGKKQEVVFQTINLILLSCRI